MQTRLYENGRVVAEGFGVDQAGAKLAEHPDAVTERGRKHLGELADVAARGERAVQLFFVNRSDVDVFRPADAIDPAYGAELRRAAAHRSDQGLRRGGDALNKNAVARSDILDGFFGGCKFHSFNGLSKILICQTKQNKWLY